MTRLLLIAALLAGLQTPGAVTGVVMSTQTRQPIGRARVAFAPVDGPWAESRVVDTGSDGRFVIERLPPGIYRVFADHVAYLHGEAAQPITIPPGQVVRDLSVALIPTGVIAGRVLTDLGEPAADVRVRAQMGAVVIEARTDDRGQYRLFNLPAGAYLISAQRSTAPVIDGDSLVRPSDGPFSARTITPLAGITARGGLIDAAALDRDTNPLVYYPGETDRAAAQPVVLGAGDEIGGVDLTVARGSRLGARQ